MKFKNLGVRLLFALWAVPLGWIIGNSTLDITQLLPESMSSGLNSFYPIHLLLLFILLLALFEYNKMLSVEFEKNLFNLSFIWFVLALLRRFFVGSFLSFTSLVFLLLMIVAAEAFFVGKGTQRWKRASLMFSGTIFLYLAGNSLFDLMETPFTALWKWQFPEGPRFFANIGVVFVFTSIFFTDTFAYFTGSLIGKHHFSTMSPKKTVEGVVGGILASTLTMTLGFYFFAASTTPLYLGVVLGVFIGIFSVVGDLLVSSMKRYFKVKDASQLIPGHGGILDRFDSIFFATPVVILIISLFNKVSGTV